MTTKTYALVHSGQVCELLTTSADVAKLYNSALQWIDVTGQNVQVGWSHTVNGFAPPATPAAPEQAPTLAELRAALAVLSARFDAFEAAAHTAPRSAPVPR